MTIHKKLLDIQTRIKVPKSQFNKFGNYKYRSCEDILETVKPILPDVGCTLFLSDEIQLVENRFYVKATATLVDVETAESIITTASAREEESKKGMDGSQVTGASSSYARKYALNGLFCIDDTKDSDTTNDGKEDKNTSNKSGSDNNKPEKPTEEPAEEEGDNNRLANGIKMIDDLVSQLKEQKVEKEFIVNTIKDNFEKNGKKSANYNAIKDVETATKIYKALKKLEVKE